MKKETVDRIRLLKGWLSDNEGNLLYELAKNSLPNGEIVEIGSFQGKSTIYISSVLRELKRKPMFSIDPHIGQTHVGKKEFESTFTAFKKNIKSFGLEKYVNSIRKTSHAASKNWKKSISLLHIDGLHEYEYVKKDLKAWLPHVIEGGIVICHDAFSPEPDVFKAIKEELLIKDCKYIGVNDSQIYVILGKPITIYEMFNYHRTKLFIKFSLKVLQYKPIPWRIRYLLVNRILKIGFMNLRMFRSILKKLVN